MSEAFEEVAADNAPRDRRMSEPEYDCEDMEKVQIYDSLRNRIKVLEECISLNQKDILRLRAEKEEFMMALLEARGHDWTKANGLIAKHLAP